MDEFRALLDRFWIRREEDRELFYQVRRKLPALRRALREQFGWEVICTEQVIRLVKEPARAQEAFGIRRGAGLLSFVRGPAFAGGQGRRPALFALGTDPGRAGLHKALAA